MRMQSSANMRKIKNVMFLFAVIIYGFVIFSKHDAHDRVTKLLIIQVDNLKGTVKSPNQARGLIVSILIDLIKHLQDSHFLELNKSETSNPTEKSELNQEKEEFNFITKKVFNRLHSHLLSCPFSTLKPKLLKAEKLI